MLTTNSNAYEDIAETSAEPEYISITNANLITNSSETVNISTKDEGNNLESYVPDERIVNASNLNGGSISPHAIIGESDDRSLVTNTEQYPYSAIAYVYVTYPDGDTVHGTAFMVSTNKALTNAHVIYDKDHGGLATSIQVIPGKNLLHTNLIL